MTLMRFADFILDCDADTVVIGGKIHIRNAMTEILKRRSTKKIISLDEKTVNQSTVIGAIRIFEKDNVLL